MKKHGVYILLLCLLAAAFCGCGSVAIQSAGEAGSLDATPVTLTGSGAEIGGGGASVVGSTVTISASGSYSLSGELTNGQIVVDTGDDAGLVTLILDNANISNATDAAIYVAQAKDVTLYLAENSVNTVTSGTEADQARFDQATASGAAIYAKDDIDIDGPGMLSVYGYLNNGIACKNDIDIKGGQINVVAVNNGVRGSDSVEISGGLLNVSAGNDGVKSTELEKAGKGYINISGGIVNITAAGDGISAERELSISGGIIDVSSGVSGAGASGKGIKAQTGLSISGGELNILSVDHSVHSGAGISISGGSLVLHSTGSKGIAAHDAIALEGGEISVVSAKDGIASETDVLISGGSVSVTAGEDGVNAKGKLVSTGGELLAVGKSKRIKSFDASSTQSFIACSISGANDTVVEVRQGDSLLGSISTCWSYNTVIYTSPGLSPGGSYAVSTPESSVDVAA